MKRSNINAKKSNNTSKILKYAGILIVTLIISTVSVKVTSNIISNYTEEPSYNITNSTESVNLYLDVINSQNLYMSAMMGALFAIRDGQPENSQNFNELNEDIVQMSALVYSFSLERATSMMESILSRTYAKDNSFSIPITQYRNKQRELENAIVGFNNFAKNNEIQTIKNYDDIRLLMTNRTVRDKIVGPQK